MTTVTSIETSAKPAGPPEFRVKDARGRMITLKQPSALSQYRIVEVAGASADNPTYMAMVLPLIFVTRIDEDPILQPTSKLQLEALITRLADEGIEAVMKGVQEHFSKPTAPTERAAP